MSEIKLNTPEGYFEKSLEKTLGEVSRIRKRRRSVLYGGAAAMILLGGVFSVQTVSRIQAEKEYLAMQSEIAELDVFLEIN